VPASIPAVNDADDPERLATAAEDSDSDQVASFCCGWIFPSSNPRTPPRWVKGSRFFAFLGDV